MLDSTVLLALIPGGEFMKSLEPLFHARPTIRNYLHSLRLVEAASQTYPDELALLAKYAKAANVGAEIGSFQGVSAAVIAAAMADDGALYCIDPWRERDGRKDPSYAIFERHVRRNNVSHKITILRGLSHEMASRLPPQIDFMFIDGDHSRQGITFDWSLAKQKLRPGGHVCLHDALTPENEPWRRPESVTYFDEVILKEEGFELIDHRHSMAVLRRAGATPKME
jgi:predicted O-methyltransferase YrrM